jgi:hypothetical protein
MNQNAKRITEGELAKELRIYSENLKEICENNDLTDSESLFAIKRKNAAEEKIKSILFDLWKNGDITIQFN